MKSNKISVFLYLILFMSVTTTSLLAGTVLQWEFLGNLYDSSGHNLNGTWVGGGTPQYGIGPYGGGYIYFDGTHHIKRSIVDSSLQLGAMTVEAYICPTSVSGEQNIIDFRSSNGGYDLRLMGNRAQYTIQLDGYSGKGILTGNEIVSNKWVHIAATRDSSGVSRIYLNGVLKKSLSDTNNSINSQYPFQVGRPVFSAFPKYFHGYIGTVRISNTALSPSEFMAPILEPATISFLTPTAGETYTVGTTQTITWESEGELANVQLSYSPDNGSTWNTIKTVPNTGSTTWIIPNTPSSECLLKISDADNPDIFDISDAPFTIQPAYPIVTSPNGGEQLYTGTQRTIYWNTVGAISTVLIEYSTDNGLNWIPVDPANVGNTKSYKWKVPHAVSEQCLIRISDAANPTSFDISNAPFSIIASTPNLIIPNDGENLLTGSVSDIRWSTTGVIENIAIDYSIDNGSSWQPVSPANSGNTGHYSWTVPYQISDQCLVRISNADHPEIFDMSENTFQIVSSLPALVSPNGGEQLLSGKTVSIQWNTTGSISDILIEYSLDNGAIWIAVTPPNTGNTGSYDWTVPYTVSKECLVRVSDASHPVVNDVSDAVFEISPLYLAIPNGREKMVVNSQFTIRWNSGEALSGNLINLKYSTNKGQDWTDIVLTENDGMYEWAVPEIESNQYLIQITDVNNPETQDISENAFMVYQCHEQIASDLDGDCTVGLSDFAIMAEQWLYEGIILSRIYAFDNSPSWTTEGQWEFGQPLGLGGASYGNPDPNSGHTGLNVYGINLSGDYNPAISGPYYLTTSVIDCTQYDNVKVSFMSWLNIDDSNYAKCSFEVSSNGTDWVVLWSNTPEPITDNDWNKMEFDISEYADDNPTLYLRWGYQIIDRAYPYSGWNVDDVELWGTL